MPKTDFLVVGQGLAGTLLSYFLMKSGYRITLIGETDKISSSRVAAGIVHPVTGRRIVKSWMAETFIPFAEETYSLCETLTGSKFYFQNNILELVKETKEYNDWIARSGAADLAGYISFPTEVPYREKLHHFPYSVRVRGACLDTKKFLHAMKDHLEKSGRVLNETFSFDSLGVEMNRVVYKDLEAGRIIFCEGYKGMLNPFWKALPWQPSKGEIVHIRCTKLQANEIISRKIFILPVGDHVYKVGSTYSWDSLNEIPTEEAREKLCHELKKILNVPFEVVGHEAGVRPTVQGRRPFLGFHPHQDRVGILNGLGTKGVMMGPWLASHLSEHIKCQAPLLPETDVKRYAGRLQNPR